MKFILINGPKRSGKSTLANRAQATLRINGNHAVTIGFSYHLKRFVHGIYLGKKGFHMDPDAFDANKEDSQELLGGMSWRQAYIHYSEKVIKPLHGDGWFGDQLVRASIETGADIVLVPDSGFRSEAERVIAAAGAKNVLLIRLHRDGCQYDETDSRGYVHLDDIGVTERELFNATDEGERPILRHQVAEIQRWING